MKSYTTSSTFIFTVITTIVLLAFTAPAQDIEADDEVIQVTTNVGQISVAIEQTKLESFSIEVTDNGVPMENVRWEAPAKNTPLQMVIIVAMNPVEKWKTDKDRLLYEIKKLGQTPGIELAGINIINDVEGFGEKLKFPKSFNTASYNDLDAAVKGSISGLQRTKGNRKAILVLTNEVESLPIDVIERTGELLSKSSLMVYLMSVNQEGLKKSENKSNIKHKVIARSNINGQDIIVSKKDYLGGLFRSFTRLATNLYTVSYDLSDADYHRVESVVKRLSDGSRIARNRREFKSNQPLAGTTAVYTKISMNGQSRSADETAVKDIQSSSLAVMLKGRAEMVSADAVKSYEQELRLRPEMKGALVLPETDGIVRKLTANLAPVMKLYGRENYTKIFVYKGDNPFIGLYRECIVIFSTKAIELLDEEQLRAAVAHELAHEMFIDEMRAADKAGNNKQHHIVEHKCDLVAVMMTSQLGDDPYAIVEADAAFAKWYRQTNPTADIGADKSPSNAKRQDCIKNFLRILNRNVV